MTRRFPVVCTRCGNRTTFADGDLGPTPPDAVMVAATCCPACEPTIGAHPWAWRNRAGEFVPPGAVSDEQALQTVGGQR